MSLKFVPESGRAFGPEIMQHTSRQFRQLAWDILPSCTLFAPSNMLQTMTTKGDA